MGATNPIPNYSEPEPKAIRKVDCHQCPFPLVSGEVQYGTPTSVQPSITCIVPIHLYVLLYLFLHSSALTFSTKSSPFLTKGSLTDLPMSFSLTPNSGLGASDGEEEKITLRNESP